jgi:2',3'-cyclic-nucleotide 2'-phosphodiesterase (5'-nucleotidase family)
MAHITILHTSDMHNKLTPSLAQCLHSLKAANPASLMLDSGDAIWAGNAFWRPGGEPILDLMNGVPYDAMCMGNREFHFLDIGANSKTSRAAFPVLSANLRRSRERRAKNWEGEVPAEPASARADQGSAGAESSHTPSEAFSRRARVRPFVRFERGGLGIIVFGLTVPCITERMLVRTISDYYFEHPVPTAANLVPQLRAECDVLIALSHAGIKVDRELAEKVEGIDLILGGHTHTVTESPERVGRTCILHHGFHAHYVGRVHVEADSGGLEVRNELIPLAKA